MDLIKRKKERDKLREQNLKEEKQKQEIFKKPEKIYAPHSKKFNIIALFLFIAFITYLILNSDILMKDSCGIINGIECTDLSITPEQISFNLHNYLKEDMNITLTLEGCPETISHSMKPNTKATYTFSCSNLEKTVHKDIHIIHVGYSELPHHKIGILTGNVQ